MKHNYTKDKYSEIEKLVQKYSSKILCIDESKKCIACETENLLNEFGEELLKIIEKTAKKIIKENKHEKGN